MIRRVFLITRHVHADRLFLQPGLAHRKPRTCRDSPGPAVTREAVLQVYGADAWGWRGWFAIHTWIAVKGTGAPAYTVYEVVGWRLQEACRSCALRRICRIATGLAPLPRLLKEHRGPGVDALIDAVERAAHSYPWQTEYKAFPGPNSNTFIAWIGRQVPELGLELPFSAIGSGYADVK
jgi:Protein of unknown function (DUF3750).